MVHLKLYELLMCEGLMCPPVNEQCCMMGKWELFENPLRGLPGVNREGSQVEWAFGYCGVMNCSVACLVTNEHTGKEGAVCPVRGLYFPS